MTRPATQVSGTYHRRIGTALLSTVSDGYVDPPPDAPRGISPEDAERLIVAGLGRPGVRISVNMFAWREDGRTVLFDAGSGTTMGPTCGRLMDTLHAAGIAPGDVDDILLTHIHPDHSNGLTSDAGAALFPRATVHVHQAELAHWFDDAAMAVATERARTRYFASARFRLAPYEGRIKTFAAGPVLPGIESVFCPGHTPGHCSFRASSAGEEVLIWGDTVHVPELQVPRPDITMLYDADPALAAASRRAIFELVVRDKLLVAGMHLHFPGLARVTPDGEGYRLQTEPWAYEI